MFWKKAKSGFRVPEDGFTPKFNTPPAEVMRPCLVDGKPAMFLRWADEDRAFIRMNLLIPDAEQRSIWREFQRTGYVPSGCSTEVQRVTVALVEYPDGSLGKVDPVKVCFTDKGH